MAGTVPEIKQIPPEVKKGCCQYLGYVYSRLTRGVTASQVYSNQNHVETRGVTDSTPVQHHLCAEDNLGMMAASDPRQLSGWHQTICWMLI